MSLQVTNKSTWKPVEMCTNSAFKAVSFDDFYHQKKQQLADEFDEIGLTARVVEEADYNPLMKFIQTYYYGHASITPVRMHQIIPEGSSIILEDQKGEIKGYILEVSYLKNKVSHGAGMAVHPELKGHSIGANLFMYSAIVAMKNGAQMKKGVISPTNYKSIISIINRSGAIAIGYSDDLYDMGPKLIFNLPLIPNVLAQSALDIEKTKEMLLSGSISEIDANDLDGIKEVFNNQSLPFGSFLE